jgi:hypothetical protein
MMDIVWEYYLKINFVTIGSCVLFLFTIAAITVVQKTLSTALMDPVKTFQEDKNILIYPLIQFFYLSSIYIINNLEI